MKEQITYQDFDKIDIRLGTVISVEKNEKARKPSLVLKVDFGAKIGVKQSSAQITHFYNKENLRNFIHEALSRDIFAKGALKRAESLFQAKPGLYDLSSFK